MTRDLPTPSGDTVTPDSFAPDSFTPDDRCFFILGYGRSGTTLFRRMVSAHPNLFVPPENDMFQRLPPLIGKTLATEDALDKVLAACPPYFGKIYDLAALRQLAVDRLPLAPADFFALFFSVAWIGADKRPAIWGHKVPSEWPYIGTWRDWYPKAKFLHVVRHPLDATASMVEYQLQRYPTTPLVGIWQWRKAFRAIRRHGAALGPERYHMLRYEELVASPETVLRGVCDFLGVSAEFVPDMIAYREDATTNTQVDQGAHMEQTNAPLTEARIGRRDYSNRKAAGLSQICARELAELGYEARGGAAPGALHRFGSGAACLGLDLAWAGLRAKRRLQGQL